MIVWKTKFETVHERIGNLPSEYAMQVEVALMGAKMPKKARKKFYDQVVIVAAAKPCMMTLVYRPSWKQKRYTLHYACDTEEAARELKATLKEAGFDADISGRLPFKKREPAPAADPTAQISEIDK
jgi:hypothetical protein